ncbi:MAG: hypothetical protein ACD_50C00093G0003 [uncultured bacterium]|nr:MAG: hypothetical protein ACD_50C00093G0003 [uncultured bacterium]OGH13776.1 MAG: 50S ribosomal protein L17 [Candidatus Levybacteria bacterium RIFCSPHIGHO2_01_FULL_38_26]
MRKQVFGRQLGRDANERKALFKGLISSLILHERIKTTEEKAKAIKDLADKIITKAKKGEGSARRLLQGELSKDAINKLIINIAPRFEKRQGGYTRLVKIGKRFSDNASMVLMEWTEERKIKDQPSSGAQVEGNSPPKTDQPLAEKIKNLEEVKDKDNQRTSVENKTATTKGKKLLKASSRRTKKK